MLLALAAVGTSCAISTFKLADKERKIESNWKHSGSSIFMAVVLFAYALVGQRGGWFLLGYSTNIPATAAVLDKCLVVTMIVIAVSAIIQFARSIYLNALRKKALDQKY